MPTSFRTAEEEINYINSLSDKAIRHEFDPDPFSLDELLPGYDIGVIVLKFIEGRRITTMNIVMAVIDGAFIALDVVAIVTTVGAGGAATAGTKQVVKMASKIIIKKEANDIAKILMKNTVKTAAKNATKRVTQKAFNEAVKKAGKKLVQELMESATEKFTKEASEQLEKEVFKMVEKRLANQVAKQMEQGGTLLLEKSVQKNISTKIFNKATENTFKNKSWEKFTEFFEKNPGGVIIKTVSDDIASNAIGYAVMSAEPTQDAVRYVIRQAKNLNAEDLWKSELSAWWFLNGSNAL